MLKTISILVSFLFCISFYNANQFVQAGSSSAWNLSLEREGSVEAINSRLLSPVEIYRKHLASVYNGKPPIEIEEDWFRCVDPSEELFQRFVTQYNRSFENSAEENDRRQSFYLTLKRTILLNRVVQNEIRNETNYIKKKEIRNHHFISPLNPEDNSVLWYSDINDCELGLLKKIVFDLFRSIDEDNLADAYKKVIDNSDNLPLLSDEGFEQIANILIVKLFDRFRGDQKMNQLFQWPNYMKKLAAFAYNRRQLNQPDFKHKLSLIKFAYPSFFKDVKYNLQAANRTNDNLHAHEEHENFNKFYERKIRNIQERNKRLSIFRQRLSHLEILNDEPNKWRNITHRPDWLQPVQVDGRIPENKSGQLRNEQSNLNDIFKYKLTQFSDLTDEEFVAFLTNDFSIIENHYDSVKFIIANFPVVPLDEAYRAELAHELEIRRAILEPPEQQLQQQQSSQLLQARRNLALARRVVDELINDVGLPIGQASIEDTNEGEMNIMFNKVNQLTNKTYMNPSSVQTSPTQTDEIPINESDLLDERRRRYEQFRINYGRFKAWFRKENWTLNEKQMISMLRLADMSWQDIKLTLFRICCLEKNSLLDLITTNATLQYYSSNLFLCDQMTDDLNSVTFNNKQTASSQLDLQRKRESSALELYYYYCVHFNKHHNDVDTFNKKFAIFRYNIDHIRRHSCIRGTTLYTSFKYKLPDTLSTIDTLDPRRSYTDDINLDRFKYFTLQPSDILGSDSQSSRISSNTLEDVDATFTVVGEASASLRSRAGISTYPRGSFFDDVYSQQSQGYREKNEQDYTYPELLYNVDQNKQLYSNKYKQNSVSKIYRLVMQRYELCLQTVNSGISPSSNLPQCMPTGDLVDGNIYNHNQYGKMAKLQQQQDKCFFYRMGLEFWAEGLIKQDDQSLNYINRANCKSRLGLYRN